MEDIIDNIVFEGIDHRDHPDYCDAYIVSADLNGEPMTDEQIEELDKDFVYDELMKHIR